MLAETNSPSFDADYVLFLFYILCTSVAKREIHSCMPSYDIWYFCISRESELLKLNINNRL